MIKKITYALFITMFAISCTEKEKVTLDDVTARFKENIEKIKVVAYDNHRILISEGQNVSWDNTGNALIERNPDDKFFGFSFYGKRNDIDKEYLYDNGNGFEILKADKKYAIEHPYSVIGSPGGQMVVNRIFELDSIYKSAALTEEDDKYILTYTFEPDTVYNVTDQVKIIELRKEDLFPVKITINSKMLGKKNVNQHSLSNIRINDEVKRSIKELRASIFNYDVIVPEKVEGNPILNKTFPAIKLSNLLDENELIELKPDRLILLDFWEVWCGPCIRSFPKVESLSKKYSGDLQVIGIVSQSKESAIKQVKKKNISFTNVVGNKEILANYNVNSYPRYFLIDKNGIVKKEYYGFSEAIEEAIKTMIAE